MTPNILLLDCSYTLKEKLERQGFSVSAGTIGFCSGVRSLPSQIYESEVIVYNPSFLARTSKGNFISSENINNVTPEYSLSHLKDHILKGATLLVFANHLGDGADPNEAYEWIPFMPKLVPTKDHRVRIQSGFKYWHEPYMKLGYLDVNELAIPVRLKFGSYGTSDGSRHEIEEAIGEMIDILPLLRNQNDDVLAASFRFISGCFFVLPTFKLNDEAIAAFLNKVVPAIHGIETRRNLIDDFISLEQRKIEEKLKEAAVTQQEAEKYLEKSKEELVQAKMIKAKTIREDETAVLILNYYDLAQQQADVALFFLYKIVEALERKYGSEAEAKKQLRNNEGWNLIRRIANASYGDVRHAPKPGEKIKQWSDEEIKVCFGATNEIVKAYFATLFMAETSKIEE